MSSRIDERVVRGSTPEPSENGTMVTRRLCAYTHLDDRVCDELRDEFRIKPYEAVAPSYSVDAVAVVGHTRSAHRHHVIRDLLLVGLLCGMALSVWRALPSDKRLAILTACAMILAIAWAIGWLIRFSMKQQTVLDAVRVYYAEHRLGAVRDLAAVALLLAAAVAVLLAKAQLYDEILTLAVFLGAAWVTIGIERYLALYLAGQVMTLKHPTTSGAATLPTQLRENLARIHSPARNLVIYNSTDNFYDTFVGSGEQLDTQDISIDVSLGREDSKGARLEPKPIDVIALHQTLQQALLSVGVPGCWGGYRTYLDGRRIPQYRSEPFNPLDVVIDGSLVDTGLRENHQLYRTYLCIQITTWEGDLVVTLFMRATLTGHYLHVSTKIYVLAPMRLHSREFPRPLPRYGLARLVGALTYATRNVVSRLLRSPQRCVALPTRLLQRLLRQLWEEWQISHGANFDYGATWSARELFADPRLIHANAWDDVVGQVHLLQAGYTSALDKYLTDRDIDTSSLSESVRNLHVHQETTLTIDKVRNLATGKRGSAGDRHNSRPGAKKSPTPKAAQTGQASTSNSET